MRATVFHRHTLYPIATWLICAALAGMAMAQTTTPSAEAMIEQLKVPRTRSLRNLTVEEVHTKDTAQASRPQVPGTGDSSLPTLTAISGATPAAPPSLTLLIQFDFDSARVRSQSERALTNLSQALQSSELQASRFLIEGHTDAKGRADYNQNLSELRALAVREYLEKLGVDPTRLRTLGKGSSELANSAQPNAAENRRVKIVNLD